MILNRIEGKPEEGMHGSSVSLQDSTRGSVKTIFLVIEKKGVEFDEGQKKCADTEAIETCSELSATQARHPRQKKCADTEAIETLCSDEFRSSRTHQWSEEVRRHRGD